MKLEKNNWDLEAFIKSRSFDELTPAQQQWVLQQTPLTDYEQQRWALLATQDFFRADEVPAPPSLDSVLAKHQGRRPQQSSFSLLQHLAAWRVPAWQLGMAILFGWLFGQWNAGEKNTNLGLVPQIVYQTDTIVREIPIYIGLGKQKWAMYADSQVQQKNTETRESRPVSNRRKSRNSSIAKDRELLDLVVGMQ